MFEQLTELINTLNNTRICIKKIDDDSYMAIGYPFVRGTIITAADLMPNIESGKWIPFVKGYPIIQNKTKVACIGIKEFDRPDGTNSLTVEILGKFDQKYRDARFEKIYTKRSISQRFRKLVEAGSHFTVRWEYCGPPQLMLNKTLLLTIDDLQVLTKEDIIEALL